MRKALIPAFLLVVAAIALGSTVFREQIVSAATTPFQNVVVQNTTTNPVPVQQIGTSTTSVSGTVGIDPSKDTVNLDSADATNLAKVESDLGTLKFDSGGNLETRAHVSSPGDVTEYCLDSNNDSFWSVDAEHDDALCSGDFFITDIVASGLKDPVILNFTYKGNVVFSLQGAGLDLSGASDYQLDLTHPIHVDAVDAICEDNLPNPPCNFSLAVLGNSTGS